MNDAWKLLVLIVLVATGPRAHAEFVVEITRGQAEAIPIAIVPFASAAVSAGTFDVAQLVSDDLARSGRFKPMDRQDLLEEPHNGAAIAFDDWRRLNNDYILVGTMSAQGPDRFNIVFELYNVLTHQRLLGYQIGTNLAGLRLASHQIADMVFEKIIGVRGAFATHIAYIAVLGHLPKKTYQLIVADADGANPRVVMQSG
jgi:TolB protein